MTYKEHKKELLKDKTVRVEYEKLLPEYELARSIVEQRLRKIADKAGIPQSTVSMIEATYPRAAQTFNPQKDCERS